MSIETLLKQVHHKLAVLHDSQKRFARELAPNFRYFDYFRSDELGLSRCFAELLSPKGSHGQGNLFLREFCQTVNAPLWATPSNLKSISREQLTIQGRRIDILLEFQSGLVGIENKPWAGDQKDQLTDYAQFLRTKSGGSNWLLIFICNREPSDAALGEKGREEMHDSGQIRTIDFKEIEENWLSACAKEVEALKVRMFVQELAGYIRTEVNGELNMSEEQEIEESIFSSRNNTDAALAIFSTWPSIRKKLLETFRNELGNALASENEICNVIEPLIWEDNLYKGSAEYGFSIHFHANQVFALRFAFERPRFDQFYWGIYSMRGPIVPEYEGVSARINALMEKSFKPQDCSHYWAWWHYADEEGFGSGFRDWSSSAEPWIAIRDGSLVKAIVSLAKKVAKRFDNFDYLLMGQLEETR